MDDGDRSSDLEMQNIEIIIRNHRNRKTYINPDNRNEKKIVVRYCEDCGVMIPISRINAVNAYMCVVCQERFESTNRLYR